MPSAFDSFGYIDSFSYIWNPVKQGDEGTYEVPSGWKYCGVLTGEAIPQSYGPWTPPLEPEPFICNIIPIGGQLKPIPYVGQIDSYAFWEQTAVIGTEPFGTYWGFAYRVRGVGDFWPDPQPKSGAPKVAPRDDSQTWLGIPRPRYGSRTQPRASYRNQPDKPTTDPRQGPASGYSEYQWRRGRVDGPPQPGQQVGTRPPPDTWAPTNPHKPPPPRTKERKFKVPRWFAGLSKVAWEATEAVDVVENLFECLPKKIQKKVPKTGVTLPDAWRPGIKYASATDKAKHVYNNVNELDGDCAMRKLACNHVMDMLWGRFFGGVDNAAQRYGIKGYGRASGSMSGLYLSKKEKEAFDKWISDNPALDALRKSLDCENLGRS